MPDLTVLFYNPPSLRPPRLGAICAAALAMLASAAGRPAIASATTGGTGPTATLRPAPTQGTLTPPPADRLITLGPIDAWKPGQNPTQRWRLAGAAPVNLHDCLWLPAGTNHSIIKYLYRPHSVGFVRKGLRNALGQIKLKAFANLAIRGRVLTWRWLGRPTPRVAQALLYSMIVLEKNKNSPTVALTFLKIPRWRPTPPGRGLPPPAEMALLYAVPENNTRLRLARMVDHARGRWSSVALDGNFLQAPCVHLHRGVQPAAARWSHARHVVPVSPVADQPYFPNEHHSLRASNQGYNQIKFGFGTGKGACQAQVDAAQEKSCAGS